MSIFKLILYYVIFPGFLFTAVFGLLFSWVDRRLTGRVQWRVGPLSPFQNFYDIVKLMGKETIVPAGGSRFTFLASPLFGLAAVTIVSTLIWKTIIWPGETFIGDLIVVLYLLTIPSLAVIMGGFASGNPLASLGASREMKLILAYELPFVLVALVPVIQAGMNIQLGHILSHQANNGMVLGSFSGTIAFIVAILCMQAKLALVPFDMPEAETEIMGGTYIEYSGVPLAVYKLTRAMMLFTLPMFLVVIFWGGIGPGWHVITGVLKYVALLVIIVLIRNTAPRVRIDQAMKFFWGKMTISAAVAVILALIGKSVGLSWL